MIPTHVILLGGGEEEPWKAEGERGKPWAEGEELGAVGVYLNCFGGGGGRTGGGGDVLMGGRGSGRSAVLLGCLRGFFSL